MNCRTLTNSPILTTYQYTGTGTRRASAIDDQQRATGQMPRAVAGLRPRRGEVAVARGYCGGDARRQSSARGLSGRLTPVDAKVPSSSHPEIGHQQEPRSRRTLCIDGLVDGSGGYCSSAVSMVNPDVESAARRRNLLTMGVVVIAVLGVYIYFMSASNSARREAELTKVPCQICCAGWAGQGGLSVTNIAASASAPDVDRCLASASAGDPQLRRVGVSEEGRGVSQRAETQGGRGVWLLRSRSPSYTR